MQQPLLSVTLLVGILTSSTGLQAADPAFPDRAALGQALYFDVNLSQNRTQSCATCHNPAHGFVDDRETVVGKAVSLGDDGKSLGDRNAPTAAYARFSPLFHKNKQGEYVGGQFHDGREADLKGQAGGPPTNPIEMGMADKASVVERLQENPSYVEAFKRLFDEDIFNDVEHAYVAMATSIAAFEQTDFFAPFDSKYDRYLRGEYTMTQQEALGEALFTSNQFTNCKRCHQLKMFGGSEGETFSNYEYHNLGVPVNQAVRAATGKAADFVDHGLLDNPHVQDPEADGKFKVPTLRNVAVTGPYMHNGVFEELTTVVLFYDKFNNPKRQLNPETGQPWADPEVAKNLALETKEFKAPPLTDQKVAALVAFMQTLTDRRYEHLLEAASAETAK